jgi:phosphoribosylformylglycinamidine synthase
LIDALLDAIQAGVVRSAHDCSDGGLAVALAECCIMDRGEQFGATVDLTHWKELPARALLFGEAQGRVIVSTSMPETVLSVARTHGADARHRSCARLVPCRLHWRTFVSMLRPPS